MVADEEIDCSLRKAAGRVPMRVHRGWRKNIPLHNTPIHHRYECLSLPPFSPLWPLIIVYATELRRDGGGRSQ